MSYRKTLLAASIVASLCLSGTLNAQDSGQASQATGSGNASTAPTDQAKPDKKVKQMAAVTVVGIRASLQKSLDTKRNANAIVDAITAEDIGKFPASNVAEALAQVPGVTLDRSMPATQRVSIDGMDPSLNLSLLDGHPVAQAMWLFGDQPNRGFNYSLLPPEILGSLEIYKSPEARLPEGSIGGTVIMHTIKPLDVPANTVSGSFGINYNDMVNKQRPAGSVFYSWRNTDKTFGVDVSAQHYEQITNRQGDEVFGYDTVGNIASQNPAIASEVAQGKLKNGDLMPQEINAANFQQIEKRDSVNANIQFRPSDSFESTVSLMWMRDNLDNVNQSMYPWADLRPGGIASLGGVVNGIVTQGSSVDPNPPCANDTAGACGQKAITLADNFARGSTVTTKGVDWQVMWRPGDGWQISGQAGVSSSRNPMTSALKELAYGGSFDWNLYKGFTYTDPSTADNPNYWADYGWGGNFSTLMYKSRDEYGQLDFSKDLDGFFNQLQFGVRYASHWESQTEMVYTGATPMTLTQIGFGGLTNLEGMSSFGFTPDMRRHIQTAGADAIRDAVLSTPGLLTSAYADANSYWENSWNVRQQNSSAYLQADFDTDNLHGNVGVRFVRTKTSSYGWNVPGVCLSADSWNCDFPTGFGYIGVTSTRNDWLPALNIAYNITPDLIVRGAASETIAYAPYNQLAPYFEANDTVLTATAGNSDLKPYRSVNFDGSLEWYFNDQSVLAASVFYKHILNYIVNAATEEQRINGSWAIPGFITSTGQALVDSGRCTQAGMCNYSVTAPVDGGMAKVKGFTLSYQQPFGDSGFGLRANYTYSDASTSSGGDLPYNSKNAYNVGPYFEKGPYSGSISYNWRSSYLAGGYVAGAPSTYVDSFKELDLSLGYDFNKHFGLSFNGLNLLNSKYHAYFGSDKTELAEQYKTGRAYMLKAHFKF